MIHESENEEYWGQSRVQKNFPIVVSVKLVVCLGTPNTLTPVVKVKHSIG